MPSKCLFGTTKTNHLVQLEKPCARISWTSRNLAFHNQPWLRKDLLYGQSIPSLSPLSGPPVHPGIFFLDVLWRLQAGSWTGSCRPLVPIAMVPSLNICSMQVYRVVSLLLFLVCETWRTVVHVFPIMLCCRDRQRRRSWQSTWSCWARAVSFGSSSSAIFSPWSAVWRRDSVSCAR